MRHSLPAVVLLALACAHPPEPPLSRVVGPYRVIPVEGGVSTVSRLDHDWTGYYYDLGAYAGDLRPYAESAVLLGLGGGEMLRAFDRSKAHGAKLVGVEIDPRVLKAALEEFKVGQFGVHAVEADAFDYVATMERTDVLMVDLFNDDVMPPREFEPLFWAECRGAVSGGGLLVVNVYPGTQVPAVLKLLGGAGWRVIEQQTVKGSTVVFAE